MGKSLGFSLVEISVSFLLLSVALLGLDAMQLTSLKDAKSAYFYSVATQQMTNMIERLYKIKINSVDEQLHIWNQQNNELLPNGKGQLEGHYPSYTVSLCWENKSRVPTCLHQSIKI